MKRRSSTDPVRLIPLSRAVQGKIRSALLQWYEEAQRDLPWRRTRDPYAVWVSEVMLQQTQVNTVIGYFDRWMKRFPSVEALARADDDAVLHLWQGLGYYSRARSLLTGARTVMDRHGGQLPDSVKELRELPGIGRYTAGAIASIAFGQAEALVDGNVKRVFCRLFELAGDPAKAPLDDHLWSLAERLVPPEGGRDFNQALMELGATICTPRQPRCEVCPVRDLCLAFAHGRTQELPETRARPAPTQISAVATLCFQDPAGSRRRGQSLGDIDLGKARVLVVKLPKTAPRWAGMWQFPTAEVEPERSVESAAKGLLGALGAEGVSVEDPLGMIQHGVTRFRIQLQVVPCAVTRWRSTPTPSIEARSWVSLDELSSLSLPAAQRRIATHLQTRGLTPLPKKKPAR